MKSPSPVPGCFATAFDEREGWFTLVLEDAAPARQGDQIEGCSVAEARLAMEQLGRLHAPRQAVEEVGCQRDPHEDHQPDTSSEKIVVT